MSLVDEAMELRKKIESLPANTVEDVREKERLLAEAEEKTARLRLRCRPAHLGRVPTGLVSRGEGSSSQQHGDSGG